jgi:hypothetical protein
MTHAPNRAALHATHCLPDVLAIGDFFRAIKPGLRWSPLRGEWEEPGEKISVPTQPSTANENTNIAIKITRAFSWNVFLTARAQHRFARHESLMSYND